ALEQLLARERQRVNELEQRLAEIVKDERVWRDAATGEKAQAEAARARAEDALRRAVLSEEAARAQAVEATRRAEGDQLNARAAAEDAPHNAERAARRRASTADEPSDRNMPARLKELETKLDRLVGEMEAIRKELKAMRPTPSSGPAKR